MNQSIIRQKEKPLKVFYSKTINQSFMVPLVDEDGEKIKKLHAVTGMPMIINKLQQYEEEMFTFAPISQSVNKGTLSGFFVYEDTEKRVIDKLEELAADEKVSWLMTAEEYEKEMNPEAFKEKKAREGQEKKLAEITEAKKVSDEKVKDLQKENIEAQKALLKMQAQLEKIEKAKKVGVQPGAPQAQGGK